MNSATDAPEPVLLIIADISGYTRYMTANVKTLAHSQTLITELVEAIIHQVKAPLEVAKLEGDAIFLFCRKPKDTARWLEIRVDISRKLLEFFGRFREKLAELGRSNTCTCHACTHLEKLRLKIIVHSGEVLFHRVLHFNELAGADVIIVHRLLKNSVPATQYLLLTEAARRELQFPATMVFKTGSETYKDFGRIKTEFHDFNFDASPTPANGGKAFGARYRESLRLYLKLWFGPFRAGKNFRICRMIPAVRPRRDLPC
jgi:class 3 adenylate cyclase